MKNFEEVLLENENLVKSAAKKYKARYSRLEYEDLLQTATIAMWNAYETYEVGEAKFSSYAYLVIERSLTRYVQKMLFNKKINAEEAFTYIKKPEKKSIDEEVLSRYGLEVVSDMEELRGADAVKVATNNDIETELMLKEIVKNEKERRYLKMRYEGYTIREIAKLEGTSKSTVDRVLKTIGERNLRNDPEFRLTATFS